MLELRPLHWFVMSIAAVHAPHHNEEQIVNNLATCYFTSICPSNEFVFFPPVNHSTGDIYFQSMLFCK